MLAKYQLLTATAPVLLGIVYCDSAFAVPGSIHHLGRSVIDPFTDYASLDKRQSADTTGPSLEDVGEACKKQCKPFFTAKDKCKKRSKSLDDVAECVCDADVINSEIDCTVCGTVENEDWATPSDGKSAKEEIATLLFACKCGGNEINDDDIDISRLRGSEDKASEILKGVCPKERTQDATSLDSSQDKQGKTNTTSSPENHREGSGNSTEESGGIPNFALQVQHQGWVKLFLPIWVGTVGIAYILGMLQA